jgi:hypothetical protein
MPAVTSLIAAGTLSWIDDPVLSGALAGLAVATSGACFLLSGTLRGTGVTVMWSLSLCCLALSCALNGVAAGVDVTGNRYRSAMAAVGTSSSTLSGRGADLALFGFLTQSPADTSDDLAVRQRWETVRVAFAQTLTPWALFAASEMSYIASVVAALCAVRLFSRAVSS